MMYESGSGKAMIRKCDRYSSVYALQVRQVCNGAGVPVMYFGYYLRYGREIWSLVGQRSLSGEALIAEVALRVARWKLLGLNEAVLKVIHTDVFNVPIPTP